MSPIKVILCERSRSQLIVHELIVHGWFPIRVTLTPSSYLSPFLKYLTCNFNDLGSRQFQVIQGHQSSCCQSKDGFVSIVM